MTPRVSICVPNLNTRPFLPERFATIQAQSFENWELLVYDSHSNDGAWRYITDLATREPRMQAWQGPREGTPGSWSPCISQARGEYVYIATSDDTMPPDCLEKLVAALDAYPECDVAHCRLMPIDEHGREVSKLSHWWWNQSVFAQSSGQLLEQPSSSPALRSTGFCIWLVEAVSHLDHTVVDPAIVVRPNWPVRVEVGIGRRLQLEHASRPCRQCDSRA